MSTGNAKLLSTVTNVNRGVFRAASWNFDGEYCVTSDSSRIVSLWNPYPSADLDNGPVRPLAQYKGHNRDILCVHANADNSKISSAGEDKVVFCWDVESGRVAQRLHFHTGRVQCLRFLPTDANCLVTGSLDCQVCIWDLRRPGKPVQVLSDAKDAVYSLTVTDAQHQHRIITGSLDCRVRTYDLRKAKLYTDCVGWPVASVRTDGNEAAIVCLQDGPLRLLDLSDGQILAEYTGHVCKTFIVECDIDQDGSKVMAGSEEGGIVRVWDIVSKNVVSELKHAQASPVLTVAAHPTKSGRVLTVQNNCFFVWTQ